MRIKVTTIYPDNRHEGLEKALNDLGASRIVSVETHGDYEYKVIYEVDE